MIIRSESTTMIRNSSQARKRQKTDGTTKATFTHWTKDPKHDAFVSFFGRKAWDYLESSSQEQCFEDVIQEELASHIEAKERHLESTAEVDCAGQRIRPLLREEAATLMKELRNDIAYAKDTGVDALLARKLKIALNAAADSDRKFPAIKSDTTGPGVHTSAVSQPEFSVIKTLEAIQSTPFASSLAARVAGPTRSAGAAHEYFLRDWDAESEWLNLMDDIHEHHALAHPEREQRERRPAPIDYQCLKPCHLTQVHDLLARSFWPGIDVSDALQFSPEQCTVVATYRQLVVGAVFLSSPQELYITYLVVRAGWESSQIATRMLLFLLSRNPKHDVILHVSANNPAMLLYNRFGFKAEEFIVGFYKDYLDNQSRACKNAFRLRLRR